MDCPAYYDRDGLYGAAQATTRTTTVRFALLVAGGARVRRRTGMRPAIVHAHDWQAGLAPVYLRTRFAGIPVLGAPARVFTIHNLAYQGLFGRRCCPRSTCRGTCSRVEGLEFWGNVSFLKAGINFARRRHDRQPPLRAGDPDAASRASGSRASCGAARDALVGILNGIDTRSWNPAPTRSCPRRFGAADLRGQGAP